MNIIDKYWYLKDEFKDEFTFEFFLKRLTPSELQEVLENILTSKIEFLELFFTSVKNIDIDEVAFDIILNQPYYLIDKISECLDHIFLKAINNVIQDPKQVIKKIFVLAYNNVGLPNHLIIDIIKDNKLSSNVKINILFLLKYRNQKAFIDFFVKEYDVLKDPLIIPFICSQTKSTKKILNYLYTLNSLNLAKPDEEIVKWFRSFIYDFISDLISFKKYDKVLELKRFQTEWFRQLVEDILNSEFEPLPDFNIPQSEPIDFVIEKVIRAICTINIKYSNIGLTEVLISPKDAENLYYISKWYGNLLALVNPNIRSQVSLGKYELKGISIDTFNKKVGNFTSKKDLHSQLQLLASN